MARKLFYDPIFGAARKRKGRKPTEKQVREFKNPVRRNNPIKKFK